MDYVKKSGNSLVILQNGKVVKSDNVQLYEDPREKRIQGIHNGKAFMYIQKKPKFSLFPEKHVSFRNIQPTSSLLRNNRTPTPYPMSKRYKNFSQKKKKGVKKNNKTKNNKK
jgi:hypothetical protein